MDPASIIIGLVYVLVGVAIVGAIVGIIKKALR